MELRRSSSIFLLLLSSSCTGVITAPGGTEGNRASVGNVANVTTSNDDPASAPSADDGVKAACAQRALPTQPLRRLSDEQYRNVIGDLFGATLAAPLLTGSLFPPTIIKTGFAGDANANVVNNDQSNAIEDNADHIAATILAAPDKYLRALLPCTLPATYGDTQVDACIDAFITKFGQRAYRRPLTTSEVALARRVYDLVRPSQGATAGFVSVVQYFVQAPALLYRVERGAGAASIPGFIKLTGYEMATRLSFLFLNSAPDTTLLDAAAAGALATAEQVSAQARRLLQDPRFVDAMGAFHRDWLHVFELPAMTKDPMVFPDFTSPVQASLLAENTELGRAVLADPAANIRSLLVASEVPVNATLAKYYGVSAPGATNDATWVKAAVPHRSGLLTSGAVMAALAKVNRSNPIHRGAFVRTAVMCDPLPALPASIDTAGPLQDTASLPTARQRLAPLTMRGDCKGCHLQMNPSGFALENYDGIGRWRDQESGVAIDPSGSLDMGAGVQAFSTPDQFLRELAGSDKVRDCYSLQWLRAALGRLEAPEDACSVASLKTAVVKAGGDLRELLVALTQTDAFLYRRTVEP